MAPHKPNLYADLFDPWNHQRILEYLKGSSLEKQEERMGIPWRVISIWLLTTMFGSFLIGFAFAPNFFFAFSWGIGLGGLNLLTFHWLSKALNPSGKIQRWYLPVWLAKWCVIGLLLYLALKAGLSVLGLVSGFILSLSILAILSFLNLRHVLHPRGY